MNEEFEQEQEKAADEDKLVVIGGWSGRGRGAPRSLAALAIATALGSAARVQPSPMLSSMSFADSEARIKRAQESAQHAKEAIAKADAKRERRRQKLLSQGKK